MKLYAAALLSLPAGAIAFQQTATGSRAVRPVRWERRAIAIPRPTTTSGGSNNLKVPPPPDLKEEKEEVDMTGLALSVRKAASSTLSFLAKSDISCFVSARRE